MFGIRFLKFYAKTNFVLRRVPEIRQGTQSIFFQNKFFCSDSKNHPEQTPEIKFVLNEDQGEAHKITFENKTFTAKIGDKTLTYTSLLIIFIRSI
jgi:uncharacterized protein YwqG